MELICIQSQEHPELPLAELKAVMECEDIDAEIEKIYDTDVTITGFAGIIEVKYSIAS